MLVAGGLQALSLAWPADWLGLPRGTPLWWLQLLSLAVLCAVLLRHGVRVQQAALGPARAGGIWPPPSPGTPLADSKPDASTKAAVLPLRLPPGTSGELRRALRAAVWQAAGLGGVFATAWLAGTFWWLFISMHTYGGLPAMLAVLAVLVLAVLLASYYALACGLWMWLLWCRGLCLTTCLPRHTSRAIVLFAALWTLAELARGTLWTGFPWGAGGYAHIDGPLAVWAHWIGVYGIGGLAAALAMLLGVVFRPRASKIWTALTAPVSTPASAACWLLLATIWVTIACWTPWQDAPAPRPAVAVALLQGNIPQDEKFIPGKGIQQSLMWYGDQLLQPFNGMVIAPETAIPLLPYQLPPWYWGALERSYRTSHNRAAIIGMPLGSFETGYTNSAVGLLPQQGQVYRYDKHHLVPFGEFIPPLLRWFVRMMHIPLGDFDRGPLQPPALHWQGERWAPHICYEDLFTQELAARFAHPTHAPSVLVNLSNIAWFGNSVAIDQHLHISRMRARELARPVVRATNTGATAVIDHRGQVQAQLPYLTRDRLHARVQGRDGLTPYARWAAALGLWPLAGLSGLCVIGIALAGRQTGRPSTGQNQERAQHHRR